MPTEQVDDRVAHQRVVAAAPSPDDVKRWRDGQMALRWCAAGMVEASKQFRRVTDTCTYPPYEPPSNGMSPSALSAPPVKMRT